jgi:hypothetical protein
MCVVLGVCGAAPILRRRTARMFKPATHRARERDRHAAITGPVKCRRLARQRPCKRSRRNDTNDNAGHYQRGAALARRERVARWSLASVDRRSPLHPANSIRPQYMHLPRLRIPCDHWSASRPLESTGRAMGLTDAELNTDEIWPRCARRATPAWDVKRCRSTYLAECYLPRHRESPQPSSRLCLWQGECRRRGF